MSYQLKRVNPYWHTHPMVPTGVAIGLICGLIGYAMQNTLIAGAGAVVAGLSILSAARPIVSAVLGTLGLFGGAVQFLLVPNLSAAEMSLPMRLVSVLLFSVFYMILMDALILVVAVLYNAFAGVVGLGGVGLELEGVPDEEPAS